jgi:ABC-type multidrug transport system permease subunit
VFTGFGIAADFERGFARRLLLAAPNRLAIVAGYALVALARATMVGALLFAVALATGMEVAGNGVDVLALIVLAYLVSLAAGLFAAGVAMRTRTLQAGPAMQMPVFLVLFLAPVYVPLDLLSGWLHAVASANPFTPLVETGRDYISGSPAPSGTRFVIAAALVAAFAWWAVRGLRSAEAAG